MPACLSVCLDSFTFIHSPSFTYASLAEQRAAEKRQMVATLEQQNKTIRPASPIRPRSALAVKLLSSKIPQVRLTCVLSLLAVILCFFILLFGRVLSCRTTS